MKKVVAERVNDSYKTQRGAMVDYHSAISLLNRYVQSLPVDFFTKPVILWRKIAQAKPLFRVCLELPPQSSLREEITVSVQSRTKSLVYPHSITVTALVSFAGHHNEQ